MDFNLSDEQLLIQQSLREFITEQSEASVNEILQSMAEIDFMGISIDEEFGGAGGDFTSYVLALEEVAKASPSTALLYSIISTQVAYALNEFGSRILKEKYLTKLCQGEVIGAYAYSEQGVGEDLLTIDTTAKKEEFGYVLNGTKTFVLNGGNSDFYIVYAQTEEGLSAFVVEGDAYGLSFGRPYRKMGLDGLSAVTMTLKNVKVPNENILGISGKGDIILKQVSAVHSISLAAIAVAISQKALDMSLSYGKQRTQFKVPIITFEGLRVKVGEMSTNIEAARLLTYKAAVHKDEGKPYEEIANMAKYFAIKTGEDNVREAIQIHGGYGYTKDLGVESLYRDMKGLNVIESLTKPLVIMIADQKIS